MGLANNSYIRCCQIAGIYTVWRIYCLSNNPYHHYNDRAA
ncbi:hypothetical protein PNIG_a1192 [Pseudoalteromonas nigrifaciens]|uniref:Uncharacterized protein n=1 Tax=Pseudoalteromonas nigrifaciens TaxID=28109 RepID=A0AAC9XX90_9GAMM|nr:hypothetical protein PNIG_a1192 [Pseudoalteromonas nigrifaciens]